MLRLARDRDHNIRIQRQLLKDFFNEVSDDLYWAADAGDLPECQTLLVRGANVNYEDEDNNTPLHRASLHGRTPIVKLLIENGALGTPSKKKFNGY